jgi:hypothetical protein
MIYRAHGGIENLQQSDVMLRGVIDEHGITSAPGVQAAMQLVWTLSALQDDAGALAMADQVARSGITAEERIGGRWAAAIMAGKVGNKARARIDLTALLHELEGQPGKEQLVADIRRRLAGL